MPDKDKAKSKDEGKSKPADKAGAIRVTDDFIIPIVGEVGDNGQVTWNS